MNYSGWVVCGTALLLLLVRAQSAVGQATQPADETGRQRDEIQKAAERAADLQTPPKPTGLKAEWKRVEGNAVIELRWDAKAAGDKITTAYRLYVDDMQPGQLSKQLSVPPIKENHYAYRPENLTDRTLTIGISAVGAGGTESKPAETTVFSPGKRMAEIKGFTATRPKDSDQVEIKWDYPDVSHLAGFRMADKDGAVLADEKSLDAKARSGKVTTKSNFLKIVAVSTFGMISDAGSVYVDAGGRETERKIWLTGPEALKAEWAEQEGKKVIRLTWKDAQPDAPKLHFLRADEKQLGRMQEKVEIKVTTPGHYIYVPAQADRSYHLALVVEAVPGSNFTSGGYVETLCLAPGRSLPPANLEGSVKQEGEILLQWKYPADANLQGFRLYQDGVLIVDEKKLGAETRSWQGPLNLPLKKKVNLQLEAVGKDGSVSERGRPSIEYRSEKSS